MDVQPAELLIFDFDGVLINSEPLMRCAYASALREAGIQRAPSVEHFLTCMGMPLPDIARTLSIPAAFVPLYEKTCRERMDLVSLYDGTLQLLSAAGRRFEHLALATGKGRGRTLELLCHFDLEHYFAHIVCGDDPHPGKPDPAGVLALCERFGVSPADCSMLGDSSIDIECALRAGVLALGAGWGFSEPAALHAAGAHRVFASPGDFRNFLTDVPRESARTVSAGEWALEP